MSGALATRGLPRDVETCKPPERPGSLSHRSVNGRGKLQPLLAGVVRVFLIVEGAHDETIIRTILGDDLARLSVSAVPARGVS